MRRNGEGSPLPFEFLMQEERNAQIKTYSHLDLAKRSAERAREKEQQEREAQTSMDNRRDEAAALHEQIAQFYGPKFPGQFDLTLQGVVITVTKKAGGSSLKIEVLADDKFKLSGGAGPGGFGADVAVSMGEVTEAEMEDTLDDWFSIATV